MIKYRAVSTCSQLRCLKLSTHFTFVCTLATIASIAIQKSCSASSASCCTNLLFHPAPYRPKNVYSDNIRSIEISTDTLSFSVSATRNNSLWNIYEYIASTSNSRRTDLTRSSRLPNLQTILCFRCQNL